MNTILPCSYKYLKLFEKRPHGKQSYNENVDLYKQELLGKNTGYSMCVLIRKG